MDLKSRFCGTITTFVLFALAIVPGNGNHVQPFPANRPTAPLLPYTTYELHRPLHHPLALAPPPPPMVSLPSPTDVDKVNSLLAQAPAAHKTVSKTNRNTKTAGNSVEEMVSDMEQEKEQERKLKDILPHVTFECHDRAEGYYADISFRCEVFHYCGKPDGRRFTFFCPPGSRFNQIHLICDYDRFQGCEQSQDYFHLNEHIYPKTATTNSPEAGSKSATVASSLSSSTTASVVSRPSAASRTSVVSRPPAVHPIAPPVPHYFRPTLVPITKMLPKKLPPGMKKILANGTTVHLSRRLHQPPMLVAPPPRRSPHHLHASVAAAAKEVLGPRMRGRARRPPSSQKSRGHKSPNARLRRPTKLLVSAPHHPGGSRPKIRVLPPLHLDGDGVEGEEFRGFAISRMPHSSSPDFMPSEFLPDFMPPMPPSPSFRPRHRRPPPHLEDQGVYEEFDREPPSEFLPHPSALTQKEPAASHHSHSHRSRPHHHMEEKDHEEERQYRAREQDDEERKARAREHDVEERKYRAREQNRDSEEEFGKYRRPHNEDHHAQSSNYHRSHRPSGSSMKMAVPKSSEASERPHPPFRRISSRGHRHSQEEMEEDMTEDVGFGQTNYYYAPQYLRSKKDDDSSSMAERRSDEVAKTKPKAKTSVYHQLPAKEKLVSRLKKEQIVVNTTKPMMKKMNLRMPESKKDNKRYREKVVDKAEETTTTTMPTDFEPPSTLSEISTMSSTTEMASSSHSNVLTVTPSRVIVRKRIHTSSIGGRVNMNGHHNWPSSMLRNRSTTTFAPSSSTDQEPPETASTNADKSLPSIENEDVAKILTTSEIPVLVHKVKKPKKKPEYSRLRFRASTLASSTSTVDADESVDEVTIMPSVRRHSAYHKTTQSSASSSTPKPTTSDDVEEKSYLR